MKKSNLTQGTEPTSPEEQQVGEVGIPGAGARVPPGGLREVLPGQPEALATAGMEALPHPGATPRAEIGRFKMTTHTCLTLWFHTHCHLE